MSFNHTGFEATHDHNHCIESALKGAKTICSERGLRLTPIRELVLSLIWQSHKPLGAYDILPSLAEAGFNSAPPTVYRALEFLQEQGLVHRISTLNAYIGCPSPEHTHTGYFLICKGCHNAVEMHCSNAEQAIADQTKVLEFQIDTISTEVLGLCKNCSENAASKP